MSVPFTDACLVSRYSNVYPQIGFRFVAIAVVGGTGERRGPVFENRDIHAITLAHQPQMMTLGRWTRAQGRLSKNI